jgi:hypothetical protein
MDKDLMWFYDDQSEDYQAFRQKALALEKEYLELRQLLQAAELKLQDAPDDPYCQAKVNYLSKRIKDLEAKAPWLASGLLLEYAWWGVPH